MSGIVYRIRHVPSGLCYVGRTSRPVVDRWGEHIEALAAGHHSNKPLQRAFNADGIEAFQFSVLASEVPDRPALVALERGAIAQHGSLNRRAQRWHKVLLRLEAGTFERMDALLSDGETRASFIREAIRRFTEPVP